MQQEPKHGAVITTCKPHRSVVESNFVRRALSLLLGLNTSPLCAGGIGEMSTPELLAKREQRRKMEAQAAAVSRPGLSRRLLQPVQNQGMGQQQPHQQPNSVSGLTSQQGGRSIFSRAGLKRSAPATKAPAPSATAEAGVSAEELAKVRHDRCILLLQSAWPLLKHAEDAQHSPHHSIASVNVQLTYQIHQACRLRNVCSCHAFLTIRPVLQRHAAADGR